MTTALPERPAVGNAWFAKSIISAIRERYDADGSLLARQYQAPYFGGAEVGEALKCDRGHEPLHLQMTEELRQVLDFAHVERNGNDAGEQQNREQPRANQCAPRGRRSAR